MTIFNRIQTWYQQSLTPPLALRSFTALLGARSGQHEALASLLARFDTAQDGTAKEGPYASVPGLHNLRWILFPPAERATANAPDARRALILNLTFEGELDDILEELVLHARDEMLAVLRHCEGFSDPADAAVSYLRKREVPCGFFFRDIGPAAPDVESSKTADATLRELTSAQQTLAEFADFYSSHPPSQFEPDPAALAREFLSRFDVEPRQLPLHPLEMRQPEEQRWVRLASELMQRKQRRVARRIDDGVVRRAAHAKAHGFLHATFKVCALGSAHEAQYRVGLFQSPGEEFDAVLRPSNASDAVNGDRELDVRGLTISLNVATDRGRWLGSPGQQDFLLIDHPVFIAPNIRAFVQLLAVVEAQGWRRKAWHAARLLASPGVPRQAWIIAAALLSRPRHPLLHTFHSAVPYQLGQKHIVKYSVQPSRSRDIVSRQSTAGDDFLSRALEGSLDRRITLDFFVHALPVNGEPLRLARAVEDATLDWSHLGAERVKVATIEIQPQSESTVARAARAEMAVFSPWNALEAHRPLGSINRARRRAYPDGAAARATGPGGARSAPHAVLNVTPIGARRAREAAAQ